MPLANSLGGCEKGAMISLSLTEKMDWPRMPIGSLFLLTKSEQSKTEILWAGGESKSEILSW